MSNLKSTCILLTGASSGIGEALAVEYATRGAVLGLLARREERLGDLAKRCEAVGGTVRIYPVDATDAGATQAAADDLRSEFGAIDILIANAGIGGNNAETRSLRPDAVKKVIDINLLGAANAVHAVLPHMLERGQGQLVAISSLAGFRGLPGSAAYSASKAGMTAFFESVRLDVQHKGISVTIIQQGFIKTPLTAGRENKMPFLMDLDEFDGLFSSAGQDRDGIFYEYLWSAAMRIAGGADEVLRNQLAERALGMPGEMRADKGVPFNELPH